MTHQLLKRCSCKYTYTPICSTGEHYIPKSQIYPKSVQQQISRVHLSYLQDYSKLVLGNTDKLVWFLPDCEGSEGVDMELGVAGSCRGRRGRLCRGVEIRERDDTVGLQSKEDEEVEQLRDRAPGKYTEKNYKFNDLNRHPSEN